MSFFTKLVNIKYERKLQASNVINLSSEEKPFVIYISNL